MEKKVPEEKIQEELERMSKMVSREDIERTIREADRISRKVEESSVLEKELAKVKLLIMMLKDYWNEVYREVPYRTIIAVVVALIYILNPIDLIPDFIPVLGQMDDLAMLLFVWKLISADVRNYMEWKIREGNKEVEKLYVEAFEALPQGGV